MHNRMTADEVFPLVAGLSTLERVRLIRLITQLPHSDGDVYDAAPPRTDEFSADIQALAWEAEGWEEFH